MPPEERSDYLPRQVVGGELLLVDYPFNPYKVGKPSSLFVNSLVEEFFNNSIEKGALRACLKSPNPSIWGRLFSENIP